MTHEITIRLRIECGKEIPDLLDMVAGRAYTIDGVKDVVASLDGGESEEKTLRHRLRVHLANRYHYSRNDFAAKVEGILAESLAPGAAPKGCGYEACDCRGYCQQAAPAQRIIDDETEAQWAAFLHYPQCWDTAAYPTLKSAIHEALGWAGCSVCKGRA